MNYLVIGYGKSGRAVVKALQNKNNKVFVYDENLTQDYEVKETLIEGNEREKRKSKAPNFDVTFLPKITDKILASIDECIISPAVKLDSPIMQKIKSLGIKVIGELEFGARLSRGRLLAITGTNGKTTAVTLLGHVIKGSSVVGNIGEPITLHPKDKVLVCEVSSFQLSSIDKFRPKIAGITYIDSDHLDYHKTTQNYINAKYNIAKNMTKKDFLVLNADDPVSMHLALKTNATIYAFSTKDICRGAYAKDGKVYFTKKYKPQYIMDIKDIPLIGEHNLQNVLLCIAMARLMHISPKVIRSKIMSFRGLKHRLEKIATIDNVTYINDSKATNISATKVALCSIKDNIILLVGGSDKGYEYDELIKGLKVKKLIIFGAVKQKIIGACKRNNFGNYVVADWLFDAVCLAKTIAKIGDTVLLSPASASHDEFKNFEERGCKFEEYVLCEK